MAKSQKQRGEQLPTTEWPLVDRAGQAQSPVQHASLEQLLVRYMPALHAHLVETSRIAPEAADDLLQTFVSAKFLERNLASEADCSRGKFRTFVLTALDHFIIDHYRREAASGHSRTSAALTDPQVLDAVAATPTTPAGIFDQAWARQVLGEAVRRMEAECRTSGRPEVWELFRCRILGPIVDGTPAPTYGELAERFRFRSPSQGSNMLVTAKRMFERVLRAVVGEYAHSPGGLEDEIRDLRAVLSSPGARSA